MTNKVILLLFSLAACLVVESGLMAAEIKEKEVEKSTDIMGEDPQLGDFINVPKEVTRDIIEYLPSNALEKVAQTSKAFRSIALDIHKTRDLVKYWSEFLITKVRELTFPYIVGLVAFSPDDTLLASTYEPGKYIRITDLNTGEEGQLVGHDSLITAMAFSPDGNTLASASWDTTLKLWDVKNRTLKHSMTISPYVIEQVMFSRDDKLISLAKILCGDGTFTLWELQPGAEELRKIGERDLGETRNTRLSPDGKTIAFINNRYSLGLVDLVSGAYNFLGCDFECAAFSHDGTIVAAGAHTDKKIRLWNVQTYEQIRELDDPDPSSALTFSADGKLLASGSSTGTINLWNVGTGELIRKFAGHTETITALEFSHDGKTLASGSHDNTVRLWKAGQ